MSQTVYDNEKYYHSIPGLLVPKTVSDESIHLTINEFIDTIPNLAMALEDNLLSVERKSDPFVEKMEMLIEMLETIYARGLETEATRLLRSAQDSNQVGLAKRNFKSFITDTLSLSVAMQKAQKQEQEQSKPKLSKIEIYTNTAKSITAVSNLLDDGFVDPARVLLGDLASHHPETAVFVNLQNLIVNGNVEEAKTAIKALKNKFNETLAKMAGTDLSKKILAVDDMPEILSFVNNALKNNYKILAAPSAKAALKIMETQKPDLFILDIDMPEMDGFELATRIRQSPDHATTPIIFLTGNSSREHITTATMVGGNEFIVKPATHEYLLTKVGAFLNE